jgi:hypothetical protein
MEVEVVQTLRVEGGGRSMSVEVEVVGGGRWARAVVRSRAKVQVGEVI